MLPMWGRAQEPQWKVGLASVCITPDEPVRMSGYASRKEPSSGIASDLFAKALALEDSSGQQGVIVTTDLIGFRASMAEPTCMLIMDKTGLQRNQILINSSHTHTGPTLGLDVAELDFPKDHAEATVRYTKGLQKKIVQLVVDAFEQLEPARLSRGVGVVSFVMNRREFTDRGVILGFNPRGHVDRSAPVLRIDSLEGEMRGVLFGAACHNTTLGGKHFDISGDFAGYAQGVIEREHTGVQAMFMQGCAGDANPFPRGEEAIARKHGSDLGQEVLRVLETKLAPVRGPLKMLHQTIALPLQSHLTKTDIERLRQGRGGWRSFVAAGMLEALQRDGKLADSYSAPIALWQFGEDLTLVGLSGEVVVDYVTLLEDALGPRRLWIAAYCNDVYGYLPSARVLELGGYETRGLYYGGFGLFSPQAQDVLVEQVKQMAETARSN
ncbi:MAG: neutral/alkaline non-lysosomal ceramidase N-terminal domain-containing protein [Pirellulaceae bacterium]|nr:neutral/alkaline non-lysosomal ceramidase N-terminal domain-containing protein [Pirellulaceae bacterium]HJN12241.1 neutral/alkaline non-lysosomal ceramidase N-terminal domain-containing protein [Pirellulaceae bacterium]